MLKKIEGVWTAMVTPFSNGHIYDDGFHRNIQFQLDNGANILIAGTTGESPTLEWDEHDYLLDIAMNYCQDRALLMVGTGSNKTEDALRATKNAAAKGADAALLVDCYYNGPSSSEMRDHYYKKIAKEVPGIMIVPYIIPGRTGTQLLVEDLAVLVACCKNVTAVKEATGNLENMAKTRSLLGTNFSIMSGDDDKTYDMIKSDKIKANGVISVISNVAPGSIKSMVYALNKGNYTEAERLKKALDPFFKIVTVKTEENYGGGTVVLQKWRNPVPIKTLMNGLGMPAGKFRPPHGKMSENGTEIVRAAAREIYQKNPEVLMPIQEFYGVNLEERIMDDKHWK